LVERDVRIGRPLIGARDSRLPPPGTVLERAFDGCVVRVFV
jgi:hypothetical protein